MERPVPYLYVSCISMSVRAVWRLVKRTAACGSALLWHEELRKATSAAD